MSDLISRKDAINRLCEFGTQAERQGKPLLTTIDAKYAFVKVLDSLPSADITRTEECQKCQEAIERVLTNKERNDRPTGKWIVSEGGNQWNDLKKDVKEGRCTEPDFIEWLEQQNKILRTTRKERKQDGDGEER